MNAPVIPLAARRRQTLTDLHAVESAKGRHPSRLQMSTTTPHAELLEALIALPQSTQLLLLAYAAGRFPDQIATAMTEFTAGGTR
jgi:hypothetical protein